MHALAVRISPVLRYETAGVVRGRGLWRFLDHMACSLGKGAALWLVDGGRVQDREPGKYMVNPGGVNALSRHVANAGCRVAMRKFGQLSLVP